MRQYFTTFYAWLTFHCMERPHFLSLHQLADVWVVFTLGLLWIMLQWTFLSSLCGAHVFILPKYIPGIEMMGDTVTLRLTFWELPNYFPKWLRHVTVPPAVCKGSNFCLSLPALVTVYRFDVGVKRLTHRFWSALPRRLINILSVILCADWPCGYLLWWNIYANPLSSFQLRCLFTVEL